MAWKDSGSEIGVSVVGEVLSLGSSACGRLIEAVIEECRLAELAARIIELENEAISRQILSIGKSFGSVPNGSSI